MVLKFQRILDKNCRRPVPHIFRPQICDIPRLDYQCSHPMRRRRLHSVHPHCMSSRNSVYPHCICCILSRRLPPKSGFHTRHQSCRIQRCQCFRSIAQLQPMHVLLLRLESAYVWLWRFEHDGASNGPVLLLTRSRPESSAGERSLT